MSLLVAKRIKEVYAHPAFAKDSTMDVAVVIMEKNFIFSPTIQPICLPRDQLGLLLALFNLIFKLLIL